MKDVWMLFSKAMNKWLEDFTINDGGASFGGLVLKTEGKDMNCRQGQVFDAVQTFSREPEIVVLHKNLKMLI